jgi:nucleoside-diphosphate-sugar epimerase
MKILVVGGTGALGGHAAAHLADKGHDVSIAARNPPPAGTPMAKMPFLQGDYVAGDFTPERLKGFDSIIFAAGNDPRHIPPSSDAQAHLHHANAEAVPAFMRAAREAGVKRVVQLGSFYPQAAPELEKNNFYIRSRREACEGARAEARPGFDVISVNAPFMVGAVPGLPSMIFEPYVAWAEGKLPIPAFGPAGGTNFMSFRSLSQALEGALLRGEPGKAYLVGDENLSFADYFGLFFDAAGRPGKLESRDEAHPLLPDIAIPQGRGNWIRYEPDPTETELLGYVRGDVANAVAEVVAQYGGADAAAA